MARRPVYEARTRSRLLGRLAGATIVSFLLATAASAAISPISPSSGTVEPRQSVTASFTVVDSVTSCFVAEAPARFEVTFDGLGLNLLPLNCALGGAEVTMTVSAGAKASPGDYKVTITETALGGQLIGTHEWPFIVPAPPTTTIPSTTTTTASPPTTSAPTTTTTTRPTTTTSTGPTTSTDGSGTTTTDGPTNTTPGGGPTIKDPGTVPTSPNTANSDSVTPRTRAGDNDSAGEATGRDTSSDADDTGDAGDDDDSEVLAAGATDDDNLPYDRYPDRPRDDGPEVLSRTVLSDQLRSQLSRALPMAVADVVVSPVVIAEFLLRSLLQGAMSLLVPILIASLVGLWMVRRMREEIDDDELALSRQSMV